MRRRCGELGAATVEHAGLSLLIAAVALGAIAAIGSGPSDAGREVGFALARKLRCAAQGPGPCWRDPLTTAYGRSLAGAVRALAPAPEIVAGMLPVDFRTCRSRGCAAPGARPGLTASNRRVTVFVAVDAEPAPSITYWEYRPGVGWRFDRVAIDPRRVAELAQTPLLDSQVPALVALETLPGANHFEFAPGEEPPWRWLVDRR